MISYTLIFGTKLNIILNEKKKKYAVISQQKKRCPIMTPDDAQSPFGLLLAGSSNISDGSHFIPSIGELSCGECRS